MMQPALGRCLFAALLVLGLLAGPAQTQETRGAYTLNVDGLACPFCAYGIEKQLGAIDGVEAVETDINTGTATLTMRGGANLDEDAAREAVEAAGFTLWGFTQQAAGE